MANNPKLPKELPDGSPFPEDIDAASYEETIKMLADAYEAGLNYAEAENGEIPASISVLSAFFLGFNDGSPDPEEETGIIVINPGNETVH